MEDVDKADSPAGESRVLNLSTPVKKEGLAKKSKSVNRKWVILVLIFVLAVAPALFILIRLLNNAKTEKQYEDCVRECVLSKNSGESESEGEIPYKNCFQYCRE